MNSVTYEPDDHELLLIRWVIELYCKKCDDSEANTVLSYLSYNHPHVFVEGGRTANIFLRSAKSIINDLREIREWIFRFAWIEVGSIHQAILYAVANHFFSIRIVYEIGSVRQTLRDCEKASANVICDRRKR